MKQSKVRIVSDEEAIDAAASPEGAIWLCAPLGSSEFTDNEIGECQVCGVDIMYRPYAPKLAIKLCPDCVLLVVASRGN